MIVVPAGTEFYLLEVTATVAGPTGEGHVREAVGFVRADAARRVTVELRHS